MRKDCLQLSGMKILEDSCRQLAYSAALKVMINAISLQIVAERQAALEKNKPGRHSLPPDTHYSDSSSHSSRYHSHYINYQI